MMGYDSRRHILTANEPVRCVASVSPLVGCSARPDPCSECNTAPSAAIIDGEMIWPSECANCGNPLSLLMNRL